MQGQENLIAEFWEDKSTATDQQAISEGRKLDGQEPSKPNSVFSVTS
jgi:hypothetical protein